ncbi:MAG: CRISPR-associated endonuclease Cas2 [Saprospiraceae bacterium]
MPKAPKKTYNLQEALAAIQQAGIKAAQTEPLDPTLSSLSDRIKAILQIVRDQPIKATEMTYLIMYDITDDKVRTQIAKYLIKQGCIRIQKSVFLLKSSNKVFDEILETLKEVNAYYQNEDSIILVPINASDVRSMKLIGKNVQLSTLTDKPNTLFF